MAPEVEARFVGRRDELAALRQVLARAAAGEGSLVAITGEAGIGKTKLAVVAAADARERGMPVLWGSCAELEGAPVYWPWVQVLRALSRGDGPDRAGSDDLVPLLRDARSGGEARDPDRARFELFDRVAGALLEASRVRPSVVVLDDLHDADAGSLHLLRFLVRSLATAPLVVLATLRDGAVRGHPDAALFAEIERSSRRLALGGLGRQEVKELLAAERGRVPADEEVDDVLAASEGSPFFVLELARLPERGVRDGEGAPLPLSEGARALLRRRLAPLPERTRRALEAAAVMGREFALAPLAAALGQDGAALLDDLEPALAAGVVEWRPGELGRCGFAHALLREALYEDLGHAQRARLHAAIGDALAAERPEEDVLPSLAHHFFEAARAGGDPAKAVRWARAAGDRALALLAFEEAVRHYERARTAAELAADDDAKLDLATGLGEALLGAGDPAAAKRVLAEAVELARRRGPVRFAETVARAATLPAEVGTLDLATNALLEEALRGLPLDPSGLRARLLARLASGLHLQPGSERHREALAAEATAMARELGDPRTLEFVLSHNLLALVGPDNLFERLAIVDELLAPGAGHGRDAALAALAFRVHDLAELGERSALDLALAEFEQRTRAYPHPFFCWLGAGFRAAMAIVEGRFAEAEALVGEALARGQEVQTVSAFLNYGQQLFALRGEQGRLAELEPILTGGVAETAVVPAWRCGLAELYAVSGRLAEARREVEALAADSFASLPRDTTWLTAMCLLGSICTTLADVPRADVLYRRLAPYAGRIAAARPLVVLVNPVDHVLGGLATVAGRYDEAEAHFQSALALAERMRALPWQAHVRRSWAALRVARARGDDLRAAAQQLGEAEEIARSLGMGLLLGWIEEVREAAQARAGRPRRAAAAAAGDGPGAPGAAAAPAERDLASTGAAEVGARVPPAAEGDAPGSAARDAPPGDRTGAMQRDGALWTIVLDGRTTRLRHMVGLAHLARLLAAPRREVHVADLVAAAYEGRRGAAPDGEAARQAGVERLAGDAGELVDRKAREAYEARIRDAREELAEATRLNDRGRVELLSEEVERLAAELARGFGLGGRSRRAGSATERARVAVVRAIKYAIDKLAQSDADLAQHLRVSVRTGTFCIYDPPLRDAVAWRVDGI